MKIILGILAILVFTVGGVMLFQNRGNKQTTIQKEIIQAKVQPSITNANSPEAGKSVPLPQPEDIIRTFITLIDEKRIPDAVGMMSQINTGNDSTKQAWGVQFNAIKSVKLSDIKPYWQDQWTSEMQEFQVTLDMQIDSASANAAIPYYGWENGKNIRFVILKKENNLWKIDGIATGP